MYSSLKLRKVMMSLLRVTQMMPNLLTNRHKMALEILKGQVDVNLIGWEDLDKLKRCMRRKTPCKDIGSWRKI